MSKPSKLEEILERELHYKGEILTDSITGTPIKDLIIAWILTDLLPKERTFEESMKHYGACEDAGWNACLADIKERLS